MKYFALFLVLSLSSNPTNGQERIIGGEEVSAGQYPFLVAIYADLPGGRFFCSGTLIADTMQDMWYTTTVEWILTAGQCVNGATGFTIHMGSHILNGDDPNRVTVTASTHFLYQDNGGYDPDVLRHDVGLIKLDSPVPVTDFIKPILSANMGYLYPGASLRTMGWGQVSDSDSSFSNTARYVDVAIIDQFECQDYFGEALFNAMICTIGRPNHGICFGDIGGPLIATGLVYKNTTLTAGVASFVSGDGCESANPKGYTRVDAYKHFVDATLKAHSSS